MKKELFAVFFILSCSAVISEISSEAENEFNEFDSMPESIASIPPNAVSNLTMENGTLVESNITPIMDTGLDIASTNVTSNITKKVSCLVDDSDSAFVPIIEIVNSTELLKIMHVDVNMTSLHTPAMCVVVLFYSPSCPFSCAAAPHFNALPRVFPNIKMAAVDTSTRSNFNAQFGIVGVPSLLLFHNGRPAARFNNTSDYNLEAFAKFITKNTGMKPEGKLFVTSVDFTGPISSIPEKHTDYCLVISWIFIYLCVAYWFYYSSCCQWVVDTVRSAWRESEAQHLHAD